MEEMPTPGARGVWSGVVGDLDVEVRSAGGGVERHGGGGRVSGDVGQGFGDDAVGGDLDSGGERGKRVVQVEGDGQRTAVGAAQAGCLLAQGCSLAEFVERGWAHDGGPRGGRP
jgi:hypothetical protein